MTQVIKIKWIESPLGFTAQTSFGFVHINKETKEVTLSSFTGTRSKFFNDIKDLKQLKIKVEEMHLSTINRVLSYVQ